MNELASLYGALILLAVAFAVLGVAAVAEKSKSDSIERRVKALEDRNAE